jgi:uncharacterized protein (DUF1786 family)
MKIPLYPLNQINFTFHLIKEILRVMKCLCNFCYICKHTIDQSFRRNLIDQSKIFHRRLSKNEAVILVINSKHQNIMTIDLNK